MIVTCSVRMVSSTERMGKNFFFGKSSGTDCRLTIKSALLLDRDVGVIARGIKNAHDLGIDIRGLVEMSFDHFLINFEFEKTKKFIKILKSLKLYRTRSFHDSLVCTGMTGPSPLKDFLSTHSDRKNNKYINLISTTLFKEDGKPLFEVFDTNTLLVEGTITSFTRTIPKLLSHVIGFLNEISMASLKLFLQSYLELAKTEHQLVDIEIPEYFILDATFVGRINQQNVYKVQEILKFAKEMNLVCFVSKDAPCLNFIKDFDSDTYNKLRDFNAADLDDFIVEFDNVVIRYEIEEMSLAQCISFFKSVQIKSVKYEMVKSFYFNKIIIFFFMRIRDKMCSGLDQIDLMDFDQILEFMLYSGGNKLKSWLFGHCLHVLIYLNSWDLLRISMEYMISVGIEIEKNFLRNVLVPHVLDAGDDFISWLFHTVSETMRLSSVQQMFYVFNFLKRIPQSNKKIGIIESIMRIKRFESSLSRRFFSLICSQVRKNADLKSFEMSIQYMITEKLGMSIDQRLHCKYFEYEISNNSKLYYQMSKYCKFLRYVSATDLKTVRQIDVRQTNEYVGFIYYIISPANFEPLVDCLAGIAGRLAALEFGEYLVEFLISITNHESKIEYKDYNATHSVIKKIIEVAIGEKKIKVLQSIYDFCKSDASRLKFFKIEFDKNIVHGDLSMISSFVRANLLLMSDKAFRYLNQHSHNIPLDMMISIGPTNHSYSPNEIVQAILGLFGS